MKSKEHGSCLVCGAEAIGINFAVPTCAPCKAFFRRNAVKLGVSRCLLFIGEFFVQFFQTVDFVCRGDGDCEVAHQSRRICNCCRLAKCFRVGMQKSMIRTPAEREARNDLVRQNRQKRAQLEQMQKSKLVRTLDFPRESQMKDCSNEEYILLVCLESTVEYYSFDAKTIDMFTSN